MYRSCERYLNGGMNGNDLNIQALRHQRTIVSILAIEQLTGVAYPPVTAISAIAQADTGSALRETQENLDKARNELKDRQAKAEAADTAFKKLPKPTPTDNEETKKNRTEKQTAKMEADRSVLEQKENVIAFENKLKTARNVSTNGDSQIVVLDCGNCKAPAPSKETVKELARAVEAIVNSAFTLDEVELRCLRTLNSTEDEKLSLASYNTTVSFCEQFLSIKNSRDHNMIEAEKIEIDDE